MWTPSHHHVVVLSLLGPGGWEPACCLVGSGPHRKVHFIHISLLIWIQGNQLVLSSFWQYIRGLLAPCPALGMCVYFVSSPDAVDDHIRRAGCLGVGFIRMIKSLSSLCGPAAREMLMCVYIDLI